MKQLLLIPFALILTLIALFGLVVPVIPGILFLLAALVCLGVAFPSLRRQLEQQPRLKRFFHRLDETRYLGAIPRCKLFFWALLEMVTPGRQRF